MTDIEIAELIKDTNMYEIAHKTEYNMELNNSEEQVVAQLDSHFKAIGATGADASHEVAAFVQKVVNEEIYNTPDELLDLIFDRDTIGDFDDFEEVTTPKNTLIAYEAARGGNVPRSFLDISVLTPTWKNRQIETEISYADLEKNGWKSVATLTDYAVAACKNTMFKDIFTAIDSAIASGSANYLSVGGTTMSQSAADWMSLYIQDRTEGAAGAIVGRSKYIQQMSKLTGFVSDEMRNEVHRTGKLGVYDSVPLVPISSAKKLGDGTGLISDNVVYGIAGKIGSLNMKGEVKIYEDLDNSKEKVVLRIKNFTYGYAFNDTALDKVCRAVLSSN